MQVCPSCGEENPPKFRLCGYCGAALAAALPTLEERKVVTVFFSDLKGSTSLGENLDPESLREVMTRYFDAMTAVLLRHGATIEKFIGDAIMAVFGLPKLHEDDALRAVRAAVETREALAVLNEQLLAAYGVTLANRTGVNSGEVVAGDPTTGQRLVTGDTVNVAARLEQAAPMNDVLIGDLTYRLVRDAVVVEEVEPLELKGKAERVPAYRLIGVTDADAFQRRQDGAMVGREQELATLNGAFEGAMLHGVCRSVTVIGEAGVGKSRLIREFVGGVADRAIVLRGRCLSYGEGITFWPLVEAVRGAADIEPDDPPEIGLRKLAALTDDHRVVARVASAVGLTSEQFAIAEIFWGVRRLLEILAAERPVLLVVDDIHWAEPTFLDLLRHLVTAAERPMLLLLSARHDLLETQPDWGTEPSTQRMLLEALTPEQVGRVVDELLAGLDDHAKQRIVQAADGNPLFVEQLLSMLVDSGVLHQSPDGWVVADATSDFPIPPTIHALLSARLDHLDRRERAVIEPASVIGLRFAQEAVRSMAPDAVRDAVSEHLAAMTRKRLLRPERPDAEGDDHRFNHILIRDAAYGGLLKRARATFHEQFVAWADADNERHDRAAEHEEILGYHLEQAYRYLGQLGPLDDHGLELGRRAAERLASAGRRALARGDLPAAANLLRRAADALPVHDAARDELLPDLAEAYIELGRFDDARAVLAEATEAAAATVARARARLATMSLHLFEGDMPDWTEQVGREIAAVMPIFEAANDDAGQAHAHRLLFVMHATLGRYRQAADSAERTATLARAAGDTRQQHRGASNYAQVALHSPIGVPVVIERTEALLREITGDRHTEATIRLSLAWAYAMRGDFSHGREQAALARNMLAELGRSVVASSTSLEASHVELLADDLDAAEELLRRDYDELGALGERYVLSTVAGLLGQLRYRKGDLRDAEALSLICEDLSADDDVASQALWRGTRAKVLAARGDVEAALPLAEAMLELVKDSEAPMMRAEALTEYADVLSLSGRETDAAAARAEALQLYELKGDLVSAERLRAAPIDAPHAVSGS
jgi:class 3 adenylate cyclase/tetratricopeptide (TPR) repeat protein